MPTSLLVTSNRSKYVQRLNLGFKSCFAVRGSVFSLRGVMFTLKMFREFNTINMNRFLKISYQDCIEGRKKKKRKDHSGNKWHLEKLFSFPRCAWGVTHHASQCLLASGGPWVPMSCCDCPRTITSFSALLPLAPVTPRSGQSRAGSLQQVAPAQT